MTKILITEVKLLTTAALFPKKVIELEEFLGGEILNLTTGLCTVKIEQVKMFKKINTELKSTQNAVLFIKQCVNGSKNQFTESVLMSLQEKLRKYDSLQKVKILLEK